MKNAYFCVTNGNRVEVKPLTKGEAKLLLNTLETYRELKESDELRSNRAKNLAYNYMRERGITPMSTVEETMRMCTLVM